jgi:hypothetical protein
MDIVSLLSSLNKISLIAFLITAGFIIFQFYLFKKEISVDKTKPNIPDFKEEMSPLNYTQVVINQKKEPIKKHSETPLVMGVIVLIFFGLILLFSFLNFQSTNITKSTTVPTPIINFVASKGIRIYNQNWIELMEVELAKLQSGQTIYIAIENIKEADIDKARVRVNKKQWTADDITLKFNKEKDVFYQEYQISTVSAFLKIEAQLHSKSDGWLGD